MKNNFSSAVKGGHGEALLYAGAIGLLLSDMIPTPADAVYFYRMQKNNAKLKKGEITPKQYWIRSASTYYGLNPFWWAIVLASVYFKKGDFRDKAKLGIALVAGGAVIGVISRNIKKDIELYSLTNKNQNQNGSSI